MSLSSTNVKDVYQGDDSQTEWDYTFPLIFGTDVKVSLFDPDGVETILSTNYEVDTVLNQVTYPTEVSGLDPLPTGWQIVLARNVPLTQMLYLQRQAPFNAENIMQALDKLTMIAQQLDDRLNRTTASNPTETSSLVFPAAQTGKVLGWAADGTLTNVDPSTATIGAAPADGQIPVGSGGTYVPTTIAAGAGISVTVAAGSITITNTGSGSAGAGANSNITSFTGLTGRLKAPSGIDDVSGNAILDFIAVALAVNKIKITNAATGTGVRLEAAGTDTDVALILGGQGAGYTEILGTENEMISRTTNTALKLGGNGTKGVEYQTGQTSLAVTLTASGTVATNAALGNIFDLTAAQNFTMSNPTNPTNGQVIRYRIKQDATGSRIITWDTAFRGCTDLALPTLTTTAAKTDRISFEYKSADSKWDLIGYLKGY